MGSRILAAMGLVSSVFMVVGPRTIGVQAAVVINALVWAAVNAVVLFRRETVRER